MARSAEPGCAIVDLAWIGAGVVDEFWYRLNRQIVVDRESNPVDGHDAVRREVLDRVVGQLLHQRNDGEWRATSEVQRVAIGRRAYHVFGANGAGSAAATLDDERLTEHLGEPVGSDAPEHIRDPAWAVGHDDFNRMGRPFLRMGNGRSSTYRRR